MKCKECQSKAVCENEGIPWLPDFVIVGNEFEKKPERCNPALCSCGGIKVQIDPTIPDTEIRARNEHTGEEIRLCNVKPEHCTCLNCRNGDEHACLRRLHCQCWKVCNGEMLQQNPRCPIHGDGPEERDYYTKAEVEAKLKMREEQFKKLLPGATVGHMLDTMQENGVDLDRVVIQIDGKLVRVREQRSYERSLTAEEIDARIGKAMQSVIDWFEKKLKAKKRRS